MKQELHINTDEIRIQQFPERFYLYSSVESGNAEESYRKANELVTRFLEANPGFKSDYEVAYIQHGDDVEQGIYDQYDNAIVLLEKRPRKLSYQVLPEGDYLTAYHRGHWKTVGAAYQRMLTYIQEQGLQVEREYIERYLIDALAVDEFEFLYDRDYSEVAKIRYLCPDFLIFRQEEVVTPVNIPFTECFHAYLINHSYGSDHRLSSRFYSSVIGPVRGVFAMASTTSMPSVTWPNAAYWPSRKVLSSCTMKNWEEALSGSLARAMEMVPRTWEILFSRRSRRILL